MEWLLHSVAMYLYARVTSNDVRRRLLYTPRVVFTFKAKKKKPKLLNVVRNIPASDM
jgi:hypothetical protein